MFTGQVALDVVTIQKRKRPAGSGSWRGYALGRDAYGRWVFTPAHSTYVGVHADGHKETCEVAQDRGHTADSAPLLRAGVTRLSEGQALGLPPL